MSAFSSSAVEESLVETSGSVTPSGLDWQVGNLELESPPSSPETELEPPPSAPDSELAQSAVARADATTAVVARG